MTMHSLDPERVFDLIVIGSGPAALALVARILEARPAALYTEDEHAHLHWLQRGSGVKKGVRPLVKVGEGGRLVKKAVDDGGACDCDGMMRILVIDRLGGWMANWNRLFAAYEISHLRSPLFFHPAPFDLDALVAFAERYGKERRGRTQTRRGSGNGTCILDRNADLIEITGCVGKEISKHKQKQDRRRRSIASTTATASMGPAVNERDRKDYFVPSTSLFNDFIQQDLVQRYGLHNNGKAWVEVRRLFESSDDGTGLETRPVQMVKGQVSMLRWTDVHIRGSGSTQAFCVDVHDECNREPIRLAANAVVCATGPGPTPNVPAFLRRGKSDAVLGPGWCHSTQIGLAGRPVVPPNTVSLAIIGGGLTSAQLCDVALRQNANLHVHLIIRRHMQVKPFDVGLSWVGKYSNLEKMQFWQEDDPQARLAKLLAARNGGSITPRYAKLLKELQHQGRLTVHTCTDVIDGGWEPEAAFGEWTLSLSTKQTLKVNYVIAATGAAPNLSRVPFMSDILGKQPVAQFGGLPFLTENLQYGDQLPLFFTGAFSALQIGPGAFNLEGMRAAADRIAIRLQEIASPPASGEEVDVQQPSASNYTHFAYHLLPPEVEA